MSFRLILIGVTIGCLAGGCAQQNPGPAPTVTAPPTTEELPQIPELVRRGTVNVVVQGRTVAPRAALVPDFTLPSTSGKPWKPASAIVWRISAWMRATS